MLIARISEVERTSFQNLAGQVQLLIIWEKDVIAQAQTTSSVLVPN